MVVHKYLQPKRIPPSAVGSMFGLKKALEIGAVLEFVLEFTFHWLSQFSTVLEHRCPARDLWNAH